LPGCACRYFVLTYLFSCDLKLNADDDDDDDDDDEYVNLTLNKGLPVLALGGV